MRRGFTLIELMVVIGMILVLAGVMSVSVKQAQARAKLSRAETEAKELTNAILAYQNYVKDGSLASKAVDNAPAEEAAFGFLLGREGEIPVLFNATIANGMLVDPWGNPYYITIKEGETVSQQAVQGADLRVFCPNWHRIGGTR